ncbi:S-layer homology domain-containing protein [Baaleninema sp.]|uniref:S-layer homology domain-containing protein n=1 Tax=Baaleninema sp. TaxID=3101197 RepID=UPI003D0589F7
MTLTSCAGSPWGESLQDSFAADPQLQDETPRPSPSPKEGTSEEALPDNFPDAIPRYTNARLVQTDAEGDRVRTQWQSSDPANVIAQFYKSQFQDNNWQLLETDETGDRITLTARRQGLDATLSVRPHPENRDTELVIEYQSSSPSNTSDANTSDANTSESETPSPTPPPQAPDATPTPSAVTSTPTTEFSDLASVSDPLRPYVEDLAALGVLTAAPPNSDTFSPDLAVSRREYARWLLETNNKLYTNDPAQQLRLASPTSTPAFQDVPSSDRDFPVIQALAETGIVPSPLSGAETTVQFQPDAPLTREDMLRWKIPLDLRRALPTASIDAVKETWGFQDTSRIDPDALPAVLADFQNGDRSTIRRAFGYTTLLQPKKAVTRAEAAASLWRFGYQSEGRSVRDLLDRE